MPRVRAERVEIEEALAGLELQHDATAFEREPVAPGVLCDRHVGDERQRREQCVAAEADVGDEALAGDGDEEQLVRARQGPGAR